MDVDDVNADSAEVLGIVDGRASAAVSGCLASRSPAWRNRIQVLAITPSSAVQERPSRNSREYQDQRRPVPSGELTSPMLTRVRQRLVRKREQRRGRKIDLACAHPLEARQSIVPAGLRGTGERPSFQRV